MSGLLAPQQFAGDDGSGDPALVAALTGYAGGEADLAAVAGALANARVLVPVVAVLGEAEQSSLTGLTSDKNADMALVLLTSPQGQQALPVFTSLETLHRWNPEARPVPVQSRRAALSGVDEGCEVIVVDPAGPDTAVLARPAVWALAQGRRWTPSFDDPEVVAAVMAGCSGVEGVREVSCEPGEQAELRVVAHLVPGLSRERLDLCTQAISAALGAEPLVAERVASLELTLR